MKKIPLLRQTVFNYKNITITENGKLAQLRESLFQKLLRRRKQTKDLSHLLSLDDRLLKDIGISRNEVKKMLHETSFIYLDCDFPHIWRNAMKYDFNEESRL
ncbi:DUF1127 domain-containing protein [bacterium]|nr:DUF1127 domain-containing protein [bacterium]